MLELEALHYLSMPLDILFIQEIEVDKDNSTGIGIVPPRLFKPIPGGHSCKRPNCSAELINDHFNNILDDLIDVRTYREADQIIAKLRFY